MKYLEDLNPDQREADRERVRDPPIADIGRGRPGEERQGREREGEVHDNIPASERAPPAVPAILPPRRFRDGNHRPRPRRAPHTLIAEGLI